MLIFFHLSSQDHYVLTVNYPVAVCDTLLRGCVRVSMTRSRATWQHAGTSPGWRVPRHLPAKARALWSFPSEPPFPSEPSFPFPTSTSTCKALFWSSLVARGPLEFAVCRRSRMGSAARMQPCADPKTTRDGGPRVQGFEPRAVGNGGAVPRSPAASRFPLPNGKGNPGFSQFLLIPLTRTQQAGRD